MTLNGTPIHKLRNKHLLAAFRPQGFPKVLGKWVAEGFTLDWKKMCRKMWKSGAPHKWNDTVFLALHRALWTGEKAKRCNFMKIPWNCPECGVLETVSHLFWDCVRAREVRAEMGDKWKSLADYFADSSVSQRVAFWATWKGRCDDGREERGYCRNRMRGEVRKLIDESTKA